MKTTILDQSEISLLLLIAEQEEMRLVSILNNESISDETDKALRQRLHKLHQIIPKLELSTLRDKEMKNQLAKRAN